MSEIFTASMLYAMSQNDKCRGNEKCHWCGAPCEQTHIHDDPLPLPFTKTKTTAKFPGNSYACKGCWIWRQGSKTTTFLALDTDGSIRFKDRQKTKDHSWWVTWHGAAVVEPSKPKDIYELLLKPPFRFFLALRRDADILLHLSSVNDFKEIKADTPLKYTIDNVEHAYTIYELDHALKHGGEGTEPGVQALLRFFDPYTIPTGNEERERGRPKNPEDGKNTKKVVASIMSGNAAVTPHTRK